MEKRFSLKDDGRTLATLILETDNRLTLEHELTFDELRMLPKVVPVDEANRTLRIQAGKIRSGIDVAFYDDAGAEQLGMGYDKFGFLDVYDPKGVAGLRTALTGFG